MWLIVIFVLIVFILFYRTDQIKLRSHDYTYIPELELGDKDNKMSRHLKIRFIYVCPSNIFDQIKQLATHNNVRELFRFNKDIQYTAFFVIETEDVSIYINQSDMIVEYPYKLYDTYVMGDTRIFNDINNIKDILICQGYDRDLYGLNCISTTYLNELCSNKLEYVKYFVKHGLMTNTFIKNIKNIKNIKKYGSYSGFYIKAPYSSRSVCATKNDLHPNCFVKEGVIVQAENHSLKKYELKCYVVNGSITMILVRLDGVNRNICVKDDMSNIDPILHDLITKHKSEIHLMCKKAFYCMNSLIQMRLDKLEVDTLEANRIISSLNIDSREKLRIKYILTGLVNSAKIDMINEINNKYDKNFDAFGLTSNVGDYKDPMDLDKDPIDLDEVKIYDIFMRVDLAFPDNSNYNTMTITEIEPLASGIYLPKTVMPCMKSDELNDFNSIVKYNLYHIISNLHQ